MIKRMSFVAALCALLSVSASAGMMLSDDFNSENGGTYQLNYGGFTNWEVGGGTVDLIGVGSSWNWFPDHKLYVDMDGSTGNAGKMTSRTAFDFIPGVTYVLSFDLAGNQRAATSETVRVQVAMGAAFGEDYSLSWDSPFTTFAETFSVAVPTSANLSFEGLGGDNVGMLLDNVSLSVVPVPGAALLGVLGLGAAGVRLRKRT